jgi:hypothetical protein
MKKLFVILTITQIILAENIEDEIMNKIDVKKEIEEELVEGAHAMFLHPPFLPPYLAERNMRIYYTCEFLEFALKPYYYKYLKELKVNDTLEIKNYEVLFWYLTYSTHILIGEVVKVEDGIIYYNGKCDSYCKKALIKVVKAYKGEFKKNIIPVWFITCEERIPVEGPIQMVFVRDTVLVFLVNLPEHCDAYIKDHGKDINYFLGDFFVIGDCGVYSISEIKGEKRVLGCVGQDFNLPYENVIDILNTFVPICEKLQEKARKYKFPLKDEEYAEFMKKRGYHYPLTDEEWEKLAEKKIEKLKEVKNERKNILGF